MTESNQTGALSRPGAHLDGQVWLGANYWSRTGGPFMWRAYDDAVVRAELRVLRDHGLRLTRSFLFWPDFQPAPDTIAEEFVEHYLRFLRASAEEQVATIPTFLVGHMSGEDWDVSWRGGRDLYRDGFMLGQQAFFIREMVRRIGDDPAVAGWLISNEFTNYAGISDPDYVRAWALVCTHAVRAGGSPLPVSLGDGAWTMELTGRDNGFRIERQDDVVDFFGPHSYPMDDDQVRVHFAAALACELSHRGKPVLLEEFGVPNSFSSESASADLYRQALHHSLLAGATGWIAWNNTDFDLPDVDPYRHHAFELGFGLTWPDGTPKSTLAELARFREVLDAIDFPGCARTGTDTAILVPSYLDQHPRIPPAERPPIARITGHAYIAAKAADLRPALIREPASSREPALSGEPASSRDPAPAVRPKLVLVPANKLLTAPTLRTLEQWAQAGSSVYLSWFAGVSGIHRGSWWPDVAGLSGLPHLLRYGLLEPVDDVVTWEFVAPLGDLAAGERLSFPVAGAEQARGMLPLDESGGCPPGTEVIARDGQGRPALVRRSVGAGAIYVATYPVEFFGSARPHAHIDDQVHRLYRALAVAAGALPEVSMVDSRVCVDGLRHTSGREYVWLVSLSGEPVTARVTLPAGARLTGVPDGDGVGPAVQLDPFGVRVCELLS